MVIKIVKNIFRLSPFIIQTQTQTQNQNQNQNQNTQLDLNKFKEIRYETSQNNNEVRDYFLYNKPGGIMKEYYDNDNRVGYIRYYITTGQIGLFFIEKPYRNRGLGKQILSKVINELQENNCDECWVVASNRHEFWSNVFNKSFTYRDPAHPSITGDGYYLHIKSL